jgi:hypothetical protein
MKKKILIGIAASMIFAAAFISVKAYSAEVEDPAARCRLWCTPGSCCVIVCANGWNYICYGVY